MNLCFCEFFQSRILLYFHFSCACPPICQRRAISSFSQWFDGLDHVNHILSECISSKPTALTIRTIGTMRTTWINWTNWTTLTTLHTLTTWTTMTTQTKWTTTLTDQEFYWEDKYLNVCKIRIVYFALLWKISYKNECSQIWFFLALKHIPMTMCSNLWLKLNLPRILILFSASVLPLFHQRCTHPSSFLAKQLCQSC